MAVKDPISAKPVRNHRSKTRKKRGYSANQVWLPRNTHRCLAESLGLRSPGDGERDDRSRTCPAQAARGIPQRGAGRDDIVYQQHVPPLETRATPRGEGTG